MTSLEFRLSSPSSADDSMPLQSCSLGSSRSLHTAISHPWAPKGYFGSNHEDEEDEEACQHSPKSPKKTTSPSRRGSASTPNASSITSTIMLDERAPKKSSPLQLPRLLE